METKHSLATRHVAGWKNTEAIALAARINSTTEELKTNAILIAVAPEFLAALESLTETINSLAPLLSMDDPRNQNFLQLCALYAGAIKAIAK